MATIGIDPGATLQRSVWVLTQDGKPVASGRCDALPDCAGVDAVIIESITAPPNAQGRRTIWLRPGTNGSTILPVTRSEGRIIGRLESVCPGLPIYGIPRYALINALQSLKPPFQYSRTARGTFPRGQRLDALLAAYFAAIGLCRFSGRRVSGNPHLATADHRDAFVASLYPFHLPDAAPWRIST